MSQPPTTMLGQLLSLQEPGKRLVDAGELYEVFKQMCGADYGVTGGTAAPGPTMGSFITEVTGGSDMCLPPALPGSQRMLVNVGTGAVTVNTVTNNNANGGKPDLIDGAATVSVASDTVTLFICYAPGTWTEATITGPTPPETVSGSSGS
jgi:hypothetical protein